MKYTVIVHSQSSFINFSSSTKIRSQEIIFDLKLASSVCVMLVEVHIYVERDKGSASVKLQICSRL